MKIKQLREYMEQVGVDGLFVTNPINLRYITGFTGTSGAALIGMNEKYFITDSRYIQQAKELAVGFTILQQQGTILDELGNLIVDTDISSLGFEDTMSYKDYILFEEVVPLSVDVYPTPDLIALLRQVKQPQEIELVRKACEIADKAFTYILGEIKPGIREIDLANKLDFYMRSLGASGVSFETIVASGVRSAMPHGVASEKKVQNGELITFDFGCFYQGYASDMTRTVALGEVDEELKKIYEVVLQANQKVIEVAKQNVTCAHLDKVARDIITQAGYGKYFGHSLGHSFGLEVHEQPYLSSKNDEELQANQLITDEPGIYLPDLGGVRIEDDLLVLEDGVEVLTKSPKEFITL